MSGGSGCRRRRRARWRAMSSGCCCAPRSAPAADRALVLLLMFAGLRISEAVALDLDDIRVSTRKGTVIVRSGKRDAYREVPLNALVRATVTEWLEVGQRSPTGRSGPCSSAAPVAGCRRGRRTRRSGGSRTTRASRFPRTCSAHTCLTNLVRQGEDLVMVAEIAGHVKIETTRRYSLPSTTDREAAMERIEVDFYARLAVGRAAP